jgi:hypothetical protein
MIEYNKNYRKYIKSNTQIDSYNAIYNNFHTVHKEPVVYSIIH